MKNELKNDEMPQTATGLIAVQLDCIEYHLRKEPSAWQRVSSLYRELRRMTGVGAYRPSSDPEPVPDCVLDHTELASQDAIDADPDHPLRHL